MSKCYMYVVQILWTFSIYLESVAILPQLFMISKTGEAETITSHYLFALGSYRALYVFNWIYRFSFEGFFDFIAVVAGCVQTVLYCDFFYLYITKGKINYCSYSYVVCTKHLIELANGTNIMFEIWIYIIKLFLILIILYWKILTVLVVHSV